MARSSKQDALLTRERLLDSAEQLFERQGVAGTSLQAIAEHAGLTRGAVYWHFADKADLFNAMLERVALPLEQPLLQAREAGAADPLAHLRASLLAALAATAGDARTRRVFGVLTHKVEYVDALQGVRARHLRVRAAVIEQLAWGLQAAARAGRVALQGRSAQQAAIGLHALVSGLIHNWLLAPDSFALVEVGRQAIDAYLAGLPHAPALSAAAAPARGPAGRRPTPARSPAPTSAPRSRGSRR